MTRFIIGIGAQKCASSWVHTAFGAHPQVAVSDPKELDFFSYHYDRGYQWYEDHFPQVSGHTARFECSPSYFHDPRSPARVFRYAPFARIVLTLRDPVERAYSNHLHEVLKGHSAPLPFAEALRENPAYLEQSLYHAHVARWLSVFPRRQVSILLTEDIGRDPQAAARELYRFAGLDSGFRSDVVLERRNQSDRARLPLLRGALRAGGDQMRRHGMEQALTRLKARPAVAGLLRANSIDMRRVVPPMDDPCRARLDASLAEDLRALAKLLGRDSLPWPTWSRITQPAAARRNVGLSPA